MRCPFCYEKMPKDANVCKVCGFQKSELDSASNKLVPEMRIKDPECIIKVTTIPSDMNPKLLFWLCLLGGMLGLHCFYSKRTFRGIVCVIGTIILTLGTPIAFGIVLIPVLTLDTSFSAFVGVSGAISFLIWVIDFVSIIFGKYKIPVVLKDKI